MGKNPPKWLPGERVDETILLQRKSVEQLRADAVLRRDKLQERRQKHKDKIDAKRKRKLATKRFVSAQNILKYAERAKTQARKYHKIGEKVSASLRRKTPEKLEASFKAGGIALVVRAKGNLIPRDIIKGFERLGLHKIYSARLIYVNDTRAAKLVRQLGPFSIVGYPSEAQIEQLVRTRGCLWDPARQAKHFISGNKMLEERFGEYNILCIEDLAASIAHKAEGIEAILKQLAPFDFHPPRHLYMERHRRVHDKLEVVNKDSFANYLAEQLRETKRAVRMSKAQAARDEAVRKIKMAQSTSADAVAEPDADAELPAATTEDNDPAETPTVGRKRGRQGNTETVADPSESAPPKRKKKTVSNSLKK